MQSHALSDTDRRFRLAFEACTIVPADFSHEAHVRLAYVYLSEHGTEESIARMRTALQRFLVHHGIPATKFHETLTRAWVLAVEYFMGKAPSGSSKDFIEKNSELLDSGIMLTHYSAQVLFSADARGAYVEPDLEPIPVPGRAV
ncbi:hypothetical protein A176_000625 [Myxococcus hansupus]|uniref:Uncharacterized protein n=1 Tax=Pseudomyxococcus hansupus TaxID=1297742 RepID=A0A0H4WQ47_9BACT|nr:hypothetical protein [Myxococcus hansupus]AKQ63713.1 hypothetical protein A176_000625 [Myxococcus hansupus]